MGCNRVKLWHWNDSPLSVGFCKIVLTYASRDKCAKLNTLIFNINNRQKADAN